MTAQQTDEHLGQRQADAARAETDAAIDAMLAGQHDQANADARSSVAVIPLIGIALCLGFGALGLWVFGWAWWSSHGTLVGLEALGSLGLIALGWAGADKLARRA